MATCSDEDGSLVNGKRLVEEEEEADKCVEKEKERNVECGDIVLQLPQSLQLQTGCWAEFGPSNYLKGCKWAPDGTCLLVSSADNKLRLFNLPTELYSGPVEQQLPEMSPVLSLGLGETVYDFCWYPLMSSLLPDTACLATSCKDLPVQLWDAFDLQKRASYSPHNQLSQLCHWLYSSEKRWGGQKGIVSTIAMLPTHSHMYAVGSYSSQVGVYSDLADGAVLLLTGVGGGVTHIAVSPDGNLLFVGFRKVCSHLEHCLLSGTGDGVVCGWDIRVLAGNGDLSPHFSHATHSDPVTGCSVHPHRPLLATASGQRHFPLPTVDDQEDGEEETLQDNSLKVWSLLPLPDDDS
ncbi:Telomerase Cajal body protein 1 [Geodia barretti]|uniref:WD repeat-containing protein 79 n=1 Tax=Geodia barretti TaxID=519541 RepID=A0AA35W9K2_GEOBA|nr:Telomerase Cajal body protein 1 [Geodia barretti]